MGKQLDNETQNQLELIGERMRNLRKVKFSSHEQFAYTNNIGRAQYGRYEKGKVDMTISSLLRVLKGFDISLTDFFAEGFEEQ